MSGAAEERSARRREPGDDAGSPASGEDPSGSVDAGTTTRPSHGPPPVPDSGKARDHTPLTEGVGAGGDPLRVMVLDPDGSVMGHSHDLCNALAERGSEVHLFTTSDWRSSVGRCRTRGYRPRIEFGRRAAAEARDAEGPARSFWKVVHILGYLWTLFRLLPTTRRYDVVHSQSAPMPLMDAIWLWLAGRQAEVACTVHRTLPPETRRTSWSRRARGALYRSCDILFVHTEEAGRRLRSEFGVSREKITRIRHGSADHLRDVEERAPSCPIAHGNVPVVLFLGPIRPHNGVDVLLKAANHLRRAVWDFRVVVAGRSGPAVSECEDLVRDLGLERMVEFRIGDIGEDELPAYLRQATVVVFPDRAENRNGTAISACTFGKPIVASRVGGLAEMVEEADNGILVRPGHPQPLAEALAEILRDDDLRRRYETNSLIYARTDLSWRRIGGDMAVAYRDALRRTPG